ncbi:hypothetical protein AB0I81_55345 [Nonomuraea sp. NPDC050404]|uniref:hypothetical protein n=1 Tax=Nonomuraea sp. NPDC050404 TaxID=3155783 RepID=UPI0033F704BF
MAALLLTTAIATTLIVDPATAATGPAKISYAQRTQGWEVVLTDGTVVKIPEALTTAPKDAINAGDDVPLLISGDGRQLFYYRKSDGLFVRRTVNGSEKVVSRKLKAHFLDEEWPLVSYDGSYVLTMTSAPGVGVFADLRTGKVLPPPGKTDTWGFAGFSPDGKRLLLAGERLTVFDRSLRARLRLKSRLSPAALADDHVTAAVPVGTWSKSRKVRLLNLRTGRAGDTLTARLPKGRYINDLDFDRSGRLIIRSKTRTGVAIYQLSKKKSGKTTLLREITRPDVTAWVLPGDSTYERWTKKSH